MILCWPRKRHHVVRYARRHIRHAYAPAAGYAKIVTFTCLVIGGPVAAVGGGWWLSHRLARGVDTLQREAFISKSEALPNAMPEPASLAVFATAGALAFLFRRRL